MFEKPSEPEQAPPWRAEDGPGPTMHCWPYGAGPALYVLVGERWIYATVTARADYQDSRVAYHVDIELPGQWEDGRGGGGYHRAYWWPQTGLRSAHGPTPPPTAPPRRHQSIRSR